METEKAGLTDRPSQTSGGGSDNKAKASHEVNFKLLLIVALIGVIIWFIPHPAGVSSQAWHLFAIFAATIIGFIIKPMPMGALSMVAMAIIPLTQTLPIDETLSGFENTTIWLIVIAFFISRGFIKTGLGERIAYLFVRSFGKKTLGLSYSLLCTDFVLSPAIPSNTARAGGIIYPMIRSLAEAYQSRPEDGTQRRIGAFLLKVGYQGNMITSAMFLTAMAANPLSAKLAHDVAGVNITWTGWIAASCVPGVISLIVIPLFLYKFYPPEVKETPGASEMASNRLKAMGPMKSSEKWMLVVFAVVLLLWIFGQYISITDTATALIGLAVLLLTQVLTWEDVKKETGAWDTLVWFSALVMMASYLNTLGMVPWFSHLMKGSVSHLGWILAFVILALVYLYSHYFFASMTAHISAMYAAFLAVMVAAGAPAMLSALVLAFFGDLMGSLTHYACGPAPVLFGAGYITQNRWWSLGFMCSVINVVIWIVIGGLWWKVLGLW